MRAEIRMMITGAGIRRAVRAVLLGLPTFGTNVPFVEAAKAWIFDSTGCRSVAALLARTDPRRAEGSKGVWNRCTRRQLGPHLRHVVKMVG